MILALALALSAATPYGEVFVDDFGAKGIDPPSGTYSYWPSPSVMFDSGPAIQKAIDAAPLGGTIRFAHCRYHSNSTLFLKRDVTILVTGAETIGHAMCGLRFKYATAGLVISTMVTIRGLTLQAQGRPPGVAANPAANGLTISAPVLLQGVYATYFDGDGVHIEAAVANGTNANSWRIDGGAASNNGGWGLYVRGSDTNAGTAISFSAINNVKGGIHEDSFLGNTYVGCHTDANKGPAIESGVEYVNGLRTENRNDASLFLNQYVEDGTYGDLATRSMWIGGMGASSTRGQGSILQIDGAGWKSDHFTAFVAGKAIARLGSLATGSSNEVFGPSTTPIYTTPSTIRAGWVDTTALRGSSAVSYRVSTSSSADGAGQFEAPSGVRVSSGGPRVTAGTIAPAVGTWKRGDFMLNASPSIGAPLGWRCTVSGSPGTWIVVSAP